MAQQTVIKFNIGGTRYEVSQSLLQSYPDSMLAKSAADQWHTDPNAEIFIDRNGSRFQYVLDYLRDGKVHLPLFVSKDSLVLDLKFYGLENIKENAIVEKMDTSCFCKSALLVDDILKSWNKQKDILADCVTILQAFRKQDVTSLKMANLKRCGRSFKDCNEELKKFGIRVVDEDFFPMTSSPGKYDVSLALLE